MAFFLRSSFLRRDHRIVGIVEKLLRAALSGGAFTQVPIARSRMMSSIRGWNNRSTELRLRMALVSAGISGWTLHARSVIGRPDFLFETRRVIVFVDGCFWHGCPKCRHAIRTRRIFWETKIELNRKRDRRTTKILSSNGYRVLRFWEHEVSCTPSICVQRITALLGAANDTRKKARMKVRHLGSTGRVGAPKR
jgi:DNA mismatch endonuclease (patch repair protein)